MKRKSLLVFCSLAVILFSAAFIAGKASASTGCFLDTNGHWAETFICWLKDNNISGGYPDSTYHPDSYITRAEMAVMLQKMRTTGITYINNGPNQWQINGVGSRYVTYYTNVADLKASVAGQHGYQASASIPSSINNAQMYFNGVRLCYNASLGASILKVYARHYDSAGGKINEVADLTTRTDTACRTYSFTTPLLLSGNDFGIVYVVVNIPTASNYVQIEATTFILAPSANAAVLLPNMELPVPTLRNDPGAAQ